MTAGFQAYVEEGTDKIRVIIVRPRRARTKIGFLAPHEFGPKVLAIGAADLPHGAVYLVFEDIDRM